MSGGHSPPGHRERRDLVAHLVVFGLVNVALWALWASTDRGYPWPAWITGAWAVGLLAHAQAISRRRP